jgi:hypothetical protein
MRILRLFVAILVSLHPFLLPAQAPESILDSLANGRKPEKIFTHFDKEFYLPGETIWFKTYLIVDGRPATTSSVVKAELINRDGSIISSQILPVTIGSTYGSMSLPGNLAYGAYVFRLFTQHMLLSGPETFYYKAIPVISSATDLVQQPASDLTLQFFAESGIFLADELNILAFAVTDQQGKPSTLNGSIKDSKGEQIAIFSTEYNGMGKVEITPRKGEQYVAEYTLASGEKRTLKLPEVANEGTNLLVVDEVLKKRLIVNTRASLDPGNKPSYIIGEMDQTLIFKIDISKSTGRYMGRVPVTDLPGGLLHIAVFNDEHKVLAERTCFVNTKNEMVQPVISPVSASIQKRTENKYEFMLPDSLEGTLSISVTDLSQAIQTFHPENILSAVLFTSSLRSSITNPLYDTQPLGAMEKNDHLDLLLLTQGYKWDWKALSRLAGIKMPASPENFISLRGMALADRNNKPPLTEADLAFLVQTKDSAFNSFVARTDNKGIFEVDGLFFEDTATVYIRNNAEKNRDKRLQVEMMTIQITEKYKYPVNAALLSSSIPFYLKQSIPQKAVTRPETILDIDSNVIMLEELVLTSKARSPQEQVESQYSKGIFSSGARTSLDFVNNPSANQSGNIFDYLKGRYSYMQVLGNYPNYSLVYRAMRSLGSGGFIPMNLFLDEFPADATMLSTIPMREIALVRIYSSGIMGNGGALAVYTKRGGDESKTNKLFENMTKLVVPGFSRAVQFYTPDYNSKKLNVKTDNRRTIYWNPSLTYIPEDGKLPITFFTNDSGNGYKIVVQGFTTEGKLLYLEKVVK